MKNKRYFYISKESALRGIAITYKITDEAIEGWNEDYFNQGKSLEVYAHTVPHFMVLDIKTGEVREKTRTELYHEGLTNIRDNEILYNGEVIDKYENGKPAYDLLSPTFDPETRTWYEGATSEELERNSKIKLIKEYDRELVFFNYAKTDFELGLISEEDYSVAKAYIKSINPFHGTHQTNPVTSRPAILDGYYVEPIENRNTLSNQQKYD